MTEEEKHKKKEFKEKKPRIEEQPQRAEVLVRIFSTDIPGNFGVYHGLTRVKGISWALSNAICSSLKLDKKKKISELTEKDIEMMTNFMKSPKIPEWLLNRRKEEESGESRHLLISELDLARDFDIRKMKKIKSYKGWRHALGQPVRGQRTRSHFRKGAAMGVQKSKQAAAVKAAADAKPSKPEKKEKK
jgi:small subunit ribosomal protein S13